LYCRELTARHKEVRVFSGPLFLPQASDGKGNNEKKFVRYEVMIILYARMFSYLLWADHKIGKRGTQTIGPLMGVLYCNIVSIVCGTEHTIVSRE